MSGSSIGRPSLQICTFVTFHFFCHWLFFLAIGNIVYLSSEYLQYLIKCSISPQIYRSLFGLLSSQLENLQPLLGNPLSPGPACFLLNLCLRVSGLSQVFPLFSFQVATLTFYFSSKLLAKHKIQIKCTVAELFSGCLVFKQNYPTICSKAGWWLCLFNSEIEVQDNG